MKKVFLFFSMIAASLLLTVACDETNDNTDVVLPDPPTKDAAVSVQFDQGEKLNLELPDRTKPTDPDAVKTGSTAQVQIRAIDMSENSRYILYIDDKMTKASTDIIWTGKFTMSGDVYKLKGFGDLKIDKDKCMISPYPVKAGTGEITLPATIKNMKTPDRMAANLARSWKVTRTFLTVTGKVSIEKDFSGCNLEEMARYCANNGINIDPSTVAGYSLTEFNFLGNNNMFIVYGNGEEFHGTYNLSSGNISWQLNKGNDFLPARATGTISFPKNGETSLTVNFSFTASGEKYTGSATMTIAQAN